MVTERTPLTGDQGPPYVFVTNPNRLYRKQIREFQCCVCSTILLIILTALIASITYSVDNDDIDNNPTNNTNSTPVAPNLTLHSLLSLSWPIPEQGEGSWKGPNLDDQQIQEAISASQLEITKQLDEVSDGPALPVDSPSYRHQQSIRTSKIAMKLAESGVLSEKATKYVSKLNKVKGSIGKGPAFKSCDDGSSGVDCQPTPYRTYDGLCNNLKMKSWGAGMKPFKREVAPDYGDGISAPRCSSDGTELPSAREVSVTIHRPVYRDDPKFTVMLAVWGQFMDHDVTATALTKGKDGGTITCCGVEKSKLHPACYPVQLKSGDSYYHKYNMTCMEFVRSSPAPSCSFGAREQLNQVSSFLDGSVVYGGSVDVANKLRTFQKGELKMLKTADGRELLPISTDPEDGCNQKEQNSKGRYCFMTGDARANENTHLTSMHLLLARQHNTLARQLSTLNPDWSDETLFQESRRILGAQMQHITYNEFLPVLLGPSLMEKLKLNSQPSGYWNGYNASVDPTVSNNFATSAFRFAHTLIPGLMKVLANDTSSAEYVELHKMLFNPYEIYSEGGLDKTLNGAMTTNVERADNYFTTELTQHLFEQVGSKVPYGLDLVSLNIQRGRDHGLPGYSKWRKYCGLGEPKSFDDLKDHIDDDSLQLLTKMYKTVDDVDMYTGGLSEKPIDGGMLGPTMTCLIANQFVRMKVGDRYWYETNEHPQAFTEAQLSEIRKSSLAGIICQNSDHVQYSQKKVMELVSDQNPRSSCSEIAQPDLTQWMQNGPEILKLSSPFVSFNVTKFGGKVTSGSASLDNGQQLWSGIIPVEIPLPSMPESNGKYKVLFDGTFKSVAVNSAELSGKFALPDSKNGSFKINLDLFWTTANATSGFTVSGEYKADIIFAERGGDAFSFLFSSQLLSSSSEVSKIILFGHYIKNNTAFTWNGNATGILVNSSKSMMHFETKSSQSTVVPNVVFENPCFGVSNGHLSVNDTMVWSGVTPVAIPVKSSLEINKTNVFAYYAKFKGNLEGNNFVGNFSLSNFDDAGMQISMGEFALRLVELNIPAMNVFQNNVEYTAKILFRQSDGRSVIDWAKEEHPQEAYAYNNGTNSWDWVVKGAKADTSTNIAIVLQGVFSTDKTSFSWSGNSVVYSHQGSMPLLNNSEKKTLTATLKADDKSDKDKAKDDDKANKGDVYGVHVSYATVTGGFDGAPAKTLLNGPFPEMFYIGNVFEGVAAWDRSIPVTWKGTLENGVFTGNYSTLVKGQTLAGSVTANVVSTFAFTPFPPNLVSPGSEYTSSMTFKQYNSLSSSPSLMSLGVPTRGIATSLELVGTFSPDGTSFYFPGDMKYVVGGAPKPSVDDNQLKLALSAKKDDGSKSDKKKKDKKDDKKDKKKPDKGETVGVMVKKAYVTAGLNGSNAEVIFNGEPPLMTYIGDIFAGMPSWARSINVLWTSEIKGNTMKGNYSTIAQGQLYAGSFSFDLAPMWKPTLDLSLIKSNAYYSSNCIFTQWGKSSGTLAPIPAPEPKKDNDSLLKLFSSAQQLTLGAIDSSIIVVGTFSPDGTSFYFPGSLRFIKTPAPIPSPDDVPSEIPTSTSSPAVTSTTPAVTSKPATKVTTAATASSTPPTISTPPSLNLTSLMSSKSKTKKDDGEINNWFKGKLVIKVLGGYVSASLENRPTESWWYEFLPVDLPSNPFWTPPTSSVISSADNTTVFSHGIIWSATDVGEFNIQGTFSMPQYVRSGELYNVQWYNGEFNFRFEPLWNSMLNNFVEPNVKYYSPLHFQSTTNPFLQSGPSYDVINSARPAPIILLGDVMPDKFKWSGAAVIVFK